MKPQSPLMSVKSGILLFIALTMVLSLGLVPRSRAQLSYTDRQYEVLANSLSADPESLKAAFLFKRRQAHNRSLSQNPAYRNKPQEIRGLLESQSQIAESYVDGSTFKGSLTELALKEGADILKNGFAVALRKPRIAMIPKEATDKAVSEFLDSMSRKPMDPKITREVQLQGMVEILKAAKSPSDPNYEYARKQLVRLKLNPDAPFEFEPRMHQALENEALKTEIKGLRGTLERISKNGEKTEADLKAMQGATTRLAEILQKNTAQGISDATAVVKSGSEPTEEMIQRAKAIEDL